MPASRGFGVGVSAWQLAVIVSSQEREGPCSSPARGAGYPNDDLTLTTIKIILSMELDVKESFCYAASLAR